MVHVRTMISAFSSTLTIVVAVPGCSAHFAGCAESRTCPPEGGAAGDSGGGTTSGSGAASGKAGTSAGGSTGGSGQAGGAGESDAGSETGGQSGGAGGTSSPCGGGCPSDKPICDESSDTCVECLIERDCAGPSNTQCDTTTNTCVECLMPAHCSTAAAARCEAGACVECEDNDDCTHLAGKGVCDGGSCVQCTVNDETPCAGKSCDPATNACTNTTIGSTGTCEACVADSECSGGGTADPTARCLPMEFNGVPRAGGFCLKRTAKTCSRPFTVTFAAQSLSGAASESYCGIDQDNVTCEAILDMVASASCGDGLDTSCGCTRDGGGACLQAGQGGLCRTVGGVSKICTIPCGNSNHCIVGNTCTLDDPYCH
jgi:hypothetical protein